MNPSRHHACPDAEIAALVELAGRNDAAACDKAAALSGDYPADARLHFFHGSLLAARGDYRDGREAMARAVALDPGFAVARFQLGLLELSSGDGEAAFATLEPLDTGGGEALALFAAGLRRLARDDMGAAAAALRTGLACADADPLICRDMKMLLDEIEATPPTAKGTDEAEETLSAAHLLLRQYGDPTRH